MSFSQSSPILVNYGSHNLQAMGGSGGIGDARCGCMHSGAVQLRELRSAGFDGPYAARDPRSSTRDWRCCRRFLQSRAPRRGGRRCHRKSCCGRCCRKLLFGALGAAADGAARLCPAVPLARAGRHLLAIQENGLQGDKPTGLTVGPRHPLPSMGLDGGGRGGGDAAAPSATRRPHPLPTLPHRGEGFTRLPTATTGAGGRGGSRSPT
jgi:hypothetical protein